MGLPIRGNDIRFSPEWCFDKEKMNLIMEEEHKNTLDAFPNCSILASNEPLHPGFGRKNLIEAVSNILEQGERIKRCPNRRSSREKREDTLEAILANMTLSLGATDTTLDNYIFTEESSYAESRPWIYYSRKNGHYAEYSPESNFSQQELLTIIEGMAKAGLIENEKADGKAKGGGLSSRFRPTQEMLTLLCLHSARVEALAFKRNSITVKDANKRILATLPEEDSIRLDSMEGIAQQISNFVSWQECKIIDNNCEDITLPVLAERIRRRKDQPKRRDLQELDTEEELAKCCQEISALGLKRKVNLYRVFNNGSLDQGGRFYGHWLQCFGKDWRKWTDLNGRQTVALDYTAMHLHILYALEKITAPSGDLYLLPDIENFNRDVAKVMALIVINAKNRKSAKLAMLNHSKDKKWNLSADQIEEYINAFVKKHKEISRYFFSSFGPRAQNIDSQIAEKVLLKLMEQNIGCIHIHDGFLVGVQDKDALAKAMDEAAQEVVGRTIPWKQEH